MKNQDSGKKNSPKTTQHHTDQSKVLIKKHPSLESVDSEQTIIGSIQTLEQIDASKEQEDKTILSYKLTTTPHSLLIEKDITPQTVDSDLTKTSSIPRQKEIEAKKQQGSEATSSNNNTLIDEFSSNIKLEPNTIRPGSTLKNRFDILEEIGSGGMGTVYKALDKRDVEAGNSCFIAIKVLNSECQNSPHLLQALYEETKKTQSLAHQNIVTVYDFDRDSDLAFMTMELIDGAPLDKIIKRNPSGINTSDALDMINQTGKALSYAHSKNIIHLDLKPNNIFFDRNKCIKILDFGISQKFSTSLSDNTEPAASLGLTPSHASIEALNDAPASPSDDIYAFACISYEILTGNHPYNKERADIAYKKKMVPKRIKSLNNKQWKALKNILELQKQNRTESFDHFLKQFNKKPSNVIFYITASLLITASVFLYQHFQLNPDIKPTVPHIQSSKSNNVETDISPITSTIESTKKNEDTKPKVIPFKKEAETKNHPQQQGNITVWLDKKSYKVGDTLKINFDVDRDLFVRIFIINSVGELTSLFPNPFQTDNQLESGIIYQIPPQNAPFTLYISEPKGEDKIIAFASHEPIPKDSVKVDNFGQVIDNDITQSYIRFETTYKIY